jgi:hypothetical protein
MLLSLTLQIEVFELYEPKVLADDRCYPGHESNMVNL